MSWLKRIRETAKDGSAQAARSPVAVIDLDQARLAHASNAYFVDVREPSEWNDGHIAGAAHHAVGTLENEPRLAIATDTPVVTYCAAGVRAARAAAALAANGYTDVHAMQAGYADWQDAGYPVDKSFDDGR